MQVRCEKAQVQESGYTHNLALIVGCVYKVLAIDGDYYRLLGEWGNPALYQKGAFTVIDPTPGDDWQLHRRSDGTVYYGPLFLEEDYMLSDYFDGKPDAVRRVEDYLRANGLWDS